MGPREVDRLAERFFAAIEAGDLDGVAALHIDDVAVWHNTGQHIQMKSQNLALLKGLRSRTETWRYGEVRRRRYEGGCSQQHMLRGKLEGAEPFEVPACIVLDMAGGKIRRIDEYLDSVALTGLFPQ